MNEQKNSSPSESGKHNALIIFVCVATVVGFFLFIGLRILWAAWFPPFPDLSSIKTYTGPFPDALYEYCLVPTYPTPPATDFNGSPRFKYFHFTDTDTYEYELHYTFIDPASLRTYSTSQPYLDSLGVYCYEPRHNPPIPSWDRTDTYERYEKWVEQDYPHFNVKGVEVYMDIYLFKPSEYDREEYSVRGVFVYEGILYQFFPSATLPKNITVEERRDFLIEELRKIVESMISDEE